MNSNEILAGRANHNNFVGDFSMHKVKFCFFKFQSIFILVIFDGIQKFIVPTQYYSLKQQN